MRRLASRRPTAARVGLTCLLALVSILAAPSLVFAQAETIEYYGTDAIGSIRIVWDVNGNMTARQDFTPFGEPVGQQGTALPKEGFVANETDAETNQDYFHARMFEARTGRFTSADPIEDGVADPQKWNRFAYGLNNPMGYPDPLGLDGCAVDSSGLNCSVTVPGTPSNGNLIPDPGSDSGGANSNNDSDPDCGTLPVGHYGLQDCSGASGGGTGTSGGTTTTTTTTTTGAPSGTNNSTGNAPSTPPTPGHCLWVATKAKGLAFSLDIVGTIPAVGNAASAASAAAGVGRAAIAVGHAVTSSTFSLGSGAYGAYGAVTGGSGDAADSLVGGASAGVGIGLTMTDIIVGGTKVIPLLGNVVSGMSAIWDGYQAYNAYQSCMAR